MNDSDIEHIDLKGNTMLPGFIDPHSHFSMMGHVSTLADLGGCESFEDIIGVLTQYINDNNVAKGNFVVGFGYDHNVLQEERHPTKEILNQVSMITPSSFFMLPAM